MKIALLISGRLNMNPILYKNTCSFFAPHFFDLFVSHSSGYSPEQISEFNALYNPKRIRESDEKCIDISEYPKRPETYSHRMMCMYLNRKYVFEVFEKYIEETQETYDIVISTRLDVFYDSPIYLDSFQFDTSTTVYIPEQYDYGGINDQLAIGKFDGMKIYMNVYDNIEYLLKLGVTVHPETILLHHLNIYQIQIQRFPLKYRIIRIAPYL